MKILYLFPRRYYDTKMSVGRVLYGEAVGKLMGVDLRIWGPGWNGYNDSLPLADNLREVWFDPDVIWSYKAGECRGAAETGKPSLVIFNEANDIQKTQDEIDAAGATHIGFHHQGDYELWKALLPDRRTFHLPHCADYCPAGVMQTAWRPIETLVTGVLAPSVYPLRCRLAELISSNRIPGQIRRHPGYRLATHEDVLRQHRDYMLQMERAKVVMTCSSKFGYPLAKFVEAMACGAVVASDMPQDEWFQRSLGRYVIRLYPEWSDAMIVDCLRRELADVAGLQQRSAGARELVEAEYSLQRYAERVLAEMQ